MMKAVAERAHDTSRLAAWQLSHSMVGCRNLQTCVIRSPWGGLQWVGVLELGVSQPTHPIWEALEGEDGTESPHRFLSPILWLQKIRPQSVS